MCNPKFAGTNCDKCDPKFTNYPNCDQCVNDKHSPPDCKSCLIQFQNYPNCDYCTEPFYLKNEKSGDCDLVFRSYDPTAFQCYLTFSFIDDYKNYYPSDTKNDTGTYTCYYYVKPKASLKSYIEFSFLLADDKKPKKNKYTFLWDNVDILTEFSNSPDNTSQLNSKTGLINVKYKLSKQIPLTFDIYYKDKVIGKVDTSS